jgi:thiamine-phosphate pyrophosphorylase
VIYLITKGVSTAKNFVESKRQIIDIITVAVECKISYIQIREKLLPAKLLFELTCEAVEITKNSETKLLVNERSDVAIAAKADGVHLTSTSISTVIIRHIYPKDFIIAVSTHTLAKAQNAQKEGADFVTYSPIFSKTEKGIGELRDVYETLKPFPVIALGGIDETNYRVVCKAASGFAAIRFLNNADNLRKLKNESLFDDSRR